jgi:outer membrane receptor for ferrienterochelin and colicins
MPYGRRYRSFPLGWRGHRKWTILAAALLSITAGNARAQSLDYGSLEALFGEPVTTSVTGSPQRISEVPASMTIVTQDDVRRSGARDLPGILRHVPGVDALQWTADNADVSIRGYNQAFSSRLLVLVNGRQVYADYYSYTPWSTLPVELSDIRQIEVVKGPNSALFGFNAVGGVINIITYDPLYDQVDTASIGGGTQNLAQGSAVATFKIGDKAGLRISLGGRRNDDFSTPQRPVEIGSRNGDNRIAGDILGHAQLGNGIDAYLELSHSEANGPEILPLYAAFSVRYRMTSIQGRLSAETPFGLVQGSAYATWFKGDATAPDPSLPVYRLDNPLYVAKLEDIFKIANVHTIRLSAEFRHTEMETTPLAGARVSYNVLSGGAMWQWNIQPELSLTNALRVDHLKLHRSGLIPPGYGLTNTDWNQRSLTETSFNSGLVWQRDVDDTFRVTSARGVQLPNILNLGGFLISAPPAGYASGSPTLKPTIVMNYELGWDHKIDDWATSLSVRVFHQTSEDISATGGGQQLPPGIAYTSGNIGNSEATGLELSLSGTPSEDWRWGLSYTPEVIKDHFLPGTDVAITLVDYEHTSPVHIVKANLGWTHGPWEIDGYLRYQSLSDGIQGTGGLLSFGTLVRIPDFVSTDARISYHITENLTLALSGQNLLQSPQKQTSAADVERSVYFTATIGL